MSRKMSIREKKCGAFGDFILKYAKISFWLSPRILVGCPISNGLLHQKRYMARAHTQCARVLI